MPGLLLWQGIVAVPGGAGGFLLGGIIIKRMSLTVVQQLRGMFVLGIVGLCTMLMFCVQCDSAPLADMTWHQHAQHTDRLVPHHSMSQTTPRPFYGPFSETIRVSRCLQNRTFWTLWCKGILTEADTPTTRLGASSPGPISAHLHIPHFLQAACPSCRLTNSSPKNRAK